MFSAATAACEYGQTYEYGLVWWLGYSSSSSPCPASKYLLIASYDALARAALVVTAPAVDSCDDPTIATATRPATIRVDIPNFLRIDRLLCGR